MPAISYYYNRAGNLSAKWPGSTVYSESGRPSKSGQIYLGLVVDKERGIFWNRAYGYCSFDTETLTFSDADPKDIPVRWREVDKTRRDPPVCIDFGDSYFLNQFIHGIGYEEVIDKLNYQNLDRIYALIHYYVLEDAANCHSDIWYRQNYIRYLYPKANLVSQRISECLAAIGDSNQKRAFLMAHIQYVLACTDGDVCVLIDSTGMPNSCDLPITRVSNHDGDVNIEFRLAALVQRSTGLPLYYEVLPGGIVDVSTVKYLTSVAKEHGCSIQYMIGDAGYCCPANIEKMILSGLDFMTRVNLTYDSFKEIINSHIDDLNDPGSNIRFHDRLVRVSKISTVVGKNPETDEEVSGFIYLCMDLQARAIKQSKFLTSDEVKKLSQDEIEKLMERMGIFAIVTTLDLKPEEILPEYYIRGKVEQFFDFGKNYAKFLPVRQHNEDTLGGHILLGFIASFLISLMSSHMKLLNTRYTAIPASLIEAEGITEDGVYVEFEDGKVCFLQEQDPVADLFRESPSTLFYELRGQKAQTFDTCIIPCIPSRQAKDMYEAFRLCSPMQVTLTQEGPEPAFDKGKENRLTKKVAFSVKPCLSEEEIAAKKKAGSRKKLEKMAMEMGLHVEEATGKQSADSDDASGPVQATVAIPQPEKRKPGRPPGSKNKKTLEREAREKEEKEKMAHKRGRKPGSKNKKTLEQEAVEKEAARREARNARRRAQYAKKKAMQDIPS